MMSDERLYHPRPSIKSVVFTLNQIRGVETISSCDGHGQKPAMAFMDCTTHGLLVQTIIGWLFELIRLETKMEN